MPVHQIISPGPVQPCIWARVLSIHRVWLTALSPIAIFFFAVGGILTGIIVALLVLTLSSNKLEGMAVTKLSTLTLLGAVVPFFVKDSLQYLLSPLPSFWTGKAACEDRLFYLLPAFALSAVWIGLLFSSASKRE